VLLIAAISRAATETAPPLSIRRTLPSYVQLQGRPPVVAWPRTGETAVEVQGVGYPESSGSFAPVPIASVAKVMTAYLTLLAHPLGPGGEGFTITITPADVAEEERRASLLQSVLPVRAGERLTERQALEALLLPSANNVAALLAVHDAGTIDAFVARMNSTARALHMRSTTYTDPSGFEDTTVSTAIDQLLLARVAMRQPTFAAIVAERSAVLPLVGNVTNFDALVGHDGYTGIKTGSDRAAGGCLMFAKRVSVGGRRLTVLGVVLGQSEGSLIEAALASAQRLGDSVAASLQVQTVLPAGTSVVSVTNADGRQTTAATTRGVREVGWSGLHLPINVTTTGLGSTLRAGQPVASVAIGADSAVSVPVVATHALDGPSLGWRLRHLL
jgi:D-alanyl-D-alanine carboxypeptidase (penicillin-binding protein 5/6)